MSQKRGIATDQINNVLQVIELGRKTGRLTVERGEAEQQEKGEIVFSNGHIVDVHCGQLSGMAAFNQLQTWGPCRFVFVNNSTEQAPGALQEYSPLTTRENSPRTTGSMTTIQRDTQPNKTTQRQSTGPLSAFSTGPLPPKPAPMQQSGTGWAGDNRGPTPRRTSPADEGLARLAQFQVSRQHRQCYLLIDGRHSFAELIRLMNRTPGEVQQILQDLINIGIVQY
ncbi:DUF4388 domain-containing protein [Ktedonobacteria bacterium brp13]|nr:DUF4388 domain-containing protein [Ktedonobacteria bacterium brp13]